MEKDIESNRYKIIRLASAISITGNLVICGAKLLIGFFSGSLSVIGDGIDSATDVVISILTLAVSFVMAKPSDKEHPWGHHRAETVASIILSVIIFIAGLQLFSTSVHKLMTLFRSKEVGILPHQLAIYVTIASIVMKLILAFNQHLMGKKANSPMIIANAKNMASDVLISASVLAGLVVSVIFELPFFDPVIAIIVSLFIVKTAVQIFLDFNSEIMDGNKNEELYKQLFEAVLEVDGAKNPHKARIRKMSNLLDIDLDIEVDKDLTVLEAHHISEEVAKNINIKLKNVYDVVIHIEPYGMGEQYAEQFGLSQKSLNENFSKTKNE
ncbi:MAG: cation transporter [Treponema sp.]|nr:MAG: cation transporter [Treponema sp.]